MLGVITFGHMADEKRLTVEVPEDIHQAFLIKSLTEKPRRSMKDRLVAFMASQVGIAYTPAVDRRKLNRKQREELERREAAPKGKKR
jgi:hypothetical protein